jgi:hypothetical protein
MRPDAPARRPEPALAAPRTGVQGVRGLHWQCNRGPGGASRGPWEARGGQGSRVPASAEYTLSPFELLEHPAASSHRRHPGHPRAPAPPMATRKRPRQPQGASGGAWGSWGALGFRGCIGGQQHPQQQHNRCQQHPCSESFHSGPPYHRGAVAPARSTARNARARTAPMTSRALTGHPRGSPRTDRAQGRQGWPAWAPRMRCKRCRSPRLP